MKVMSYNAAISAGEKVEQWQIAPNLVSYSAAISACETSSFIVQGLAYTGEALERSAASVCRSLPTLPGPLHSGLEGERFSLTCWRRPRRSLLDGRGS